MDLALARSTRSGDATRDRDDGGVAGGKALFNRLIDAVLERPPCGMPLLRVNEARKVVGIAYEEDRRVVAHRIPIALLGIEF